MINYEKAMDLILKYTTVLPTCQIKTAKSLGMVTAGDIHSKISMPPFDKSAMDGYALKALDAQRIPVKLKCMGTIAAGESFGRKVISGECIKIMTGAPVPPGADAVVMVEYTNKKADTVEIFKAVKKGQNICKAAEDIKKGQKILVKNTEIKAEHIALLTASGVKKIKVFAGPVVSVLNTGSEIIENGRKLPKNKIYNSNGPMLCSLLAKDNFDFKYLGISKDTKTELAKYIKRGLENDVLIISGGVSAGDYDLVPQVLKSLKVKKIFHKVSVKPGKPLFFGIKNKTLVFGMPGNPISNFLGYRLFVKTALLKMSGFKNSAPAFKQGILTKNFYKKGIRKQFVLITEICKNGSYFISPVTSHGSADVLSLSKSKGVMMLGEKTIPAKAGKRQKFILW